jgi:hypothetical protein
MQRYNPLFTIVTQIMDEHLLGDVLHWVFRELSGRRGATA